MIHLVDHTHEGEYTSFMLDVDSATGIAQVFSLVVQDTTRGCRFRVASDP